MPAVNRTQLVLYGEALATIFFSTNFFTASCVLSPFISKEIIPADKASSIGVCKITCGKARIKRDSGESKKNPFQIFILKGINWCDPVGSGTIMIFSFKIDDLCSKNLCGLHFSEILS